MNAISLMAIIKGVDDVYYRFDTFDTRDGFVVARRQPVTRQPRSHDNFGGGGYVSDMVRKVSETMKHSCYSAHRGEGTDTEKLKRTECLWRNYETQLPLFEV